MDVYELPPGDASPEVVNAVVEIPKGTRNKIEYDPGDGVFRLDRVLHSPVHYPGDYGFIPGTLAEDGDALDIIVLVTDPTFTGCVLEARPVGVLVMRDEKGRDEKILAVPQRDPRYEETTDIASLPGHLLREIEHFFDIYKELEGKPTATLGWEPGRKARTIIRESARRREEHGGSGGASSGAVGGGE